MLQRDVDLIARALAEKCDVVCFGAIARACDDARVDAVREFLGIERGGVWRRGDARDALFADVEIDVLNGHAGGRDDARGNRDAAFLGEFSGCLQPHAKRRMRIVDDHLIDAGDVVLRVVSDGANAQAADVVADLHRHHDGAAARVAVLHVVDEQLDARDVLGRRDRNLQIAVNDALRLLRDADALRVRNGGDEEGEERKEASSHAMHNAR